MCMHVLVMWFALRQLTEFLETRFSLLFQLKCRIGSHRFEINWIHVKSCIYMYATTSLYHFWYANRVCVCLCMCESFLVSSHINWVQLTNAESSTQKGNGNSVQSDNIWWSLVMIPLPLALHLYLVYFLPMLLLLLCRMSAFFLCFLEVSLLFMQERMTLYSNFFALIDVFADDDDIKIYVKCFEIKLHLFVLY